MKLQPGTFSYRGNIGWYFLVHTKLCYVITSLPVKMFVLLTLNNSFSIRRLGNFHVCARTYRGYCQTILPRGKSPFLFQPLELPGCCNSVIICSSLHLLVVWSLSPCKETGNYDVGQPRRWIFVHDRIGLRLFFCSGNPAGLYSKPGLYPGQRDNWSSTASFHENDVWCNEIFLLLYICLSRVCGELHQALLTVC